MELYTCLFAIPMERRIHFQVGWLPHGLLEWRWFQFRVSPLPVFSNCGYFWTRT
jgi:hypothetical protein